MNLDSDLIFLAICSMFYVMWIERLVGSHVAHERRDVAEGRRHRPITHYYKKAHISYKNNVLVAQWIERLVAVQKVAGSIPAEDTYNK